MNTRRFGYELTIKEIDANTSYEPLELCGLTGLGLDRMKSLLDNAVLPTDDSSRISGRDFVHWVHQNDLPVKKE
ncbi:hypothetical protein CIG75_06920 [Tumebacillus algifaecis]|uniref:Uncharacterized protein n=1 Tax=Tumebacillus algifaecis TaxID=1214604 RepID=A0A223CZG7_9BACL|nr:hypothetical protein [Tumebacillus algifaecis]ASS74731.1 hypothetical protein CIG75_06920 [Tumebacillus algifaecis]